jgi:hypothetical protein
LPLLLAALLLLIGLLELLGPLSLGCWMPEEGKIIDVLTGLLLLLLLLVVAVCCINN